MSGRIAIVCNGSIPGSRLPSGAQGLRAHGLHLGLRAAGRDCDIVTRESTVRAQIDRWSARSMRVPGHWRILKDKVLARHLRSDYATVIFVGWVGIDAYEKADGQRIVYDFFSPSMVEHSFISSGGRLEGKRLKKNALLAQADILIANGEGRAAYGADYVRAARRSDGGPERGAEGGPDGELPELARPLSIRLALPWSPRPQPEGAPLRVFFGGFDQAWTQGLGAENLEEIAALDGMDVTAIGIGEHLHFWDKQSRRVRRPARRVKVHDVSGLDAYRALNGTAHVSLDVFERNAERELCYSTRAVTSLASGCPVITMAFTEVGRLVAETGAGWTLEEFSLPAIKALLERLAQNRGEVAERARNTRTFWERYCDPEAEIRPLLEVL